MIKWEQLPSITGDLHDGSSNEVSLLRIYEVVEVDASPAHFDSILARLLQDACHVSSSNVSVNISDVLAQEQKHVVLTCVQHACNFKLYRVTSLPKKSFRSRVQRVYDHRGPHTSTQHVPGKDQTVTSHEHLTETKKLVRYEVKPSSRIKV